MGEHRGASEQGIRVAIVDDGVCLDHPDIKGIMGGVSIQTDPSGKIVVSEDYMTDHCHSHGTACAAIIQRRAPHSELYSIRVLDTSRQCPPEALAIAIRWAATHNMHIVNLSLGTTSQEACSLLKRACREACEAGVILIGAAHPHGLVSYPSSFPDCCACWALRHCSLCFASIEEGTGFSMDRKRRLCRGLRKGLHDKLVRVYSILEVNPKAFDFMNSYNTS